MALPGTPGLRDVGFGDAGTSGCGTQGRRDVGRGDSGTEDAGLENVGLEDVGRMGFEDVINKQHLVFSLNLLSTSFGALEKGVICCRVCQ